MKKKTAQDAKMAQSSQRFRSSRSLRLMGIAGGFMNSADQIRNVES